MAVAQPEESLKSPGTAPTEKAYLLDAVWFRPPHGADHYRQYLEMANPIARKYGARRVEALLPVEVLRGNFDPDYICVIEWPSIDQYYEFLKDIHYRAVAPIRESAIARSTQIYCRRLI